VLTLTVTIAHDAEKPHFTAACLEALLTRNADVSASVQTIVLDQTAPPADGRPACLWDVADQLREARPSFRGEYWLHCHNEHIIAPGSLAGVLAWLDGHWPDIALANLRRLCRPRAAGIAHNTDSAAVSGAIRNALLSGGGELAGLLAAAPTTRWAGPETEFAARWREDLFYARVAWLDSWGWWDVERRLWWQDIWDIMGAALRELAAAGRPAAPVRCPASRWYHLYHPKPYRGLAPEALAWLAADPARAAGTRFTPAELAALVEFLAADGLNPDGSKRLPNLKYEFRVGEGGTVWRFRQALARRLKGHLA